MKDLFEIIHSHRSIRKYRSDRVPEDILNKILEAGVRASSSGNMQPYSIVITSKDEIKRELLPLHFDQSMVMEAPLLITFCADFHRMRRWIELSQAPENFDNFMSFLIGMIDATLVSQTVALAAEAEGLGICYMGTTLASNQEISQVLKLPKHVVPVVGFSLGYPAESPEKRDRLPMSGIIHRETYQDYTDQEIQAIYSEKEIKGMARYQSVPELREMILQHNAENLAQVYTKVKYTQESHIEYSKNVMNCLINQGFL